MVERLLCKEEVRSSSLLGSTVTARPCVGDRWKDTALSGASPGPGPAREECVNCEAAQSRAIQTARSAIVIRIPQQLPVRAFARRARASARTNSGAPLQLKREDINASFAEKLAPIHLWRTTTQHSVARVTVGGRAGCWIRSSYKGRTVDALALEAEEGRVYLRKAAGSW